MRMRFLKEVFIAIALLVLTTEISAQDFKLIKVKVTEENRKRPVKCV